MHLRHPRQTCEIATMYPREILGIFGHHLQQIVRRSRHKMTLKNIRNPRDLLFKRLQHLISLPRKRDLHKHGRAAVQRAGIQKGDIFGDDLLLFQALHPPVTGRCGQVDPICKFRI